MCQEHKEADCISIYKIISYVPVECAALKLGAKSIQGQDRSLSGLNLV